MKTTEIRRLLEKYYNGQSSEEEELQLRSYFEAENIPAGYEAEKAMFRFFSENASVPLPSSEFENNIISAVDAAEKKIFIPVYKSRILVYSGIAACLLLLFGSYIFFIYNKRPRDTFSDPEIAYAETVKILFGVSSTFNHGTRQLDRVRKLEDAAVRGFAAINNSSRIIDNNLKNLDYFQQAINMVHSPMDIVKNK
jgi:hypothetical protein